jgi:hypothetical protein
VFAAAVFLSASVVESQLILFSQARLNLFWQPLILWIFKHLAKSRTGVDEIGIEGHKLDYFLAQDLTVEPENGSASGKKKVRK